MSDPPLRVALIGYGLAGRVFHAPLIATTPGLVLTGVVTANPLRRDELAADHPEVPVVDSAEDVWAAAGDYDLVVVATPNATHGALASAALEAGLHVVVDKPLTSDGASAEALVARARSAGRLLSVFQNRRWDGDALTLCRLLAEGSLGRVARFESRFERWRPVPKAGSWRERSSASEGGGLLLDLGSHLVDQATWLFGPVESVYAELASRRPDVAAEDDAFLALRHVGGTLSHLWASAVAGQLGPRYRVLGDRASYVKWGLDVQEEQLRAGLLPTDPEYGVEPPASWGVAGAGDSFATVETARGNYGAFYQQIVAAITDGAPSPVDPVDAVAGLRILEAARRSAAERTVVVLD